MASEVSVSLVYSVALVSLVALVASDVLGGRIWGRPVKNIEQKTNKKKFLDRPGIELGTYRFEAKRLPNYAM